MFRRVTNGTQLHLGRTRRHADHHPQRGREQAAAGMHHLDQAAHHLLTGREVGNHTVAQRTDGTDVIMRLLIHHLRLVTNGNHLVGTAIQSHHRRLVDHDLIIADNDRVSRSKVHGYLLNKTKKSHTIKYLIYIYYYELHEFYELFYAKDSFLYYSGNIEIRLIRIIRSR